MNTAYLKSIAKALVPLVIGTLVTIIQAVSAGTFNRGTVLAAVATLLTSASVYLVPNAPTPKVRR